MGTAILPTEITKDEEQERKAVERAALLFVRLVFWIERIAFFILATFIFVRYHDNPTESFHSILPMFIVCLPAIIVLQGCYYISHLHKTKPDRFGVKTAYNMILCVFQLDEQMDWIIQFFEFALVIMLLGVIGVLGNAAPAFVWEPDLVFALASFAGVYVTSNATRHIVMGPTYDERADYSAIKARLLEDSGNNGDDRRRKGVGDGSKGGDKTGVCVFGASPTGDAKGKEKEDRLVQALMNWEEEVLVIRAELLEATAAVKYLRRRLRLHPDQSL